MSSASANDIIERALVKARVKSPGQSIPSALQTQVYNELVDLLESWWVGEGLMVMADVVEYFTLTAGTASYTWGSGGDFDSDRPNEVKDETFVRSGNTDYPVPLYGMDVYRRRAYKSSQAIPDMVAVNYEHPLVKVYFYPTPNSAYTAHFKSSKQLISFTDQTTSVNLQPGYRRAIVSNLAVEICTNFGKAVPQSLVYTAKNSKDNIKSANSHIKLMTTPDLASMAGGGRTIDINEGPFG